MLRNQLEHGPSSLYAVAESILAMALIQAEPSNHLLATVAYGGQEARQILYDLGMPGLYAPMRRSSTTGFPALVGERQHAWPLLAMCLFDGRLSADFEHLRSAGLRYSIFQP